MTVANLSILPRVQLKIARRSAHPWIFQKMVEKPAQRIPGGSVLDILDRDQHSIDRCGYTSHSHTALRVLTSDLAKLIDDSFLIRRLHQAVAVLGNCL